MLASYRTVAGPRETEIVERKSRFICLVAPVTSEEETLSLLEATRKRHPEARHNVWAYLLRDGRERCSDDGEPQKTAGLPTLEVLRRSGLCNLAAITTRYFGGTLLGTGGLVRAYTEAVQTSLLAAGKVEFTRCAPIACTIPYAYYELVRHTAETAGGKIVATNFGAEVRLEMLFKARDAEAFMAATQELFRGQQPCTCGEEIFREF